MRLFPALLRPTFLRIAFLVLALCALALAWSLPPGHDYRDYLTQWERVLNGQDPWLNAVWPYNTYGPVHVLLAPGILIHPAFNRVLYTLVWLVLAVWFWRLIRARALREPEAPDSAPVWQVGWLAFYFFNPFFWVFTVAYGTMDVLVAASAAGALVLRARERPLLAACVLAAGTLLKFIPAFLLPFLVFAPGFLRPGPRFSGRLRGLDLRLFGVFAGLVIFAFALSFRFWGESVWKPFFTGSGRVSTYLSVFRFLRGSASPLRWFMDAPDLDAWSLPLVGAACCLVFVLYGLGRLGRATAATGVLFAVFLFYKVGHHQFYAPLFFLLPLAAWELPPGDRRMRLLWYGLAPLLWVCCAVLLFLVIRYRPEFRWLEEWLGLPSFLVGFAGLVGFLRTAGAARQI